MKHLLVLLVVVVSLAASLAAAGDTALYRVVQFADPPERMGIVYPMCAINDAGLICYSATDTGTDTNITHTFVQGPGSVVNEIVFDQQVDRAMPTSINNKGQVVGTTERHNQMRGFIWSAETGVRELLSSFEKGLAEPESINSSGVVSGMAEVRGDAGNRACIWSPDGLFRSVSKVSSTAYDLNDSGQVVGSYFTGGKETAAIWNTDGSRRDLAPLNGYQHSRGFAINSKGQAVGYSYGDENNPTKPLTLWSPNGTSIALTDSGQAFERCVDINDRGEVTAWYLDAKRTTRILYYSPASGVLEIAVPDARVSQVFQITNSGRIAAEGYDEKARRPRYMVLEPVSAKNKPTLPPNTYPSVVEGHGPNPVGSLWLLKGRG